MKCCDVFQIIEEEYPLSKAEEWDNPGLQVGHKGADVTKVMVALDATTDVVRQAKERGVQLLVTHHPLIFKPLRKICDDTPSAKTALVLAESGICCYAIHTNYDVVRMGLLNSAALSLNDDIPLMETSDGFGIGRVGNLKETQTLSSFSAMVKNAFDACEVRMYGNADMGIRRVAVCGGSGRSTINDAIEKRCDVLVTGDIDYHTALDALSMGLCIIDAGHFGTEHIFIDEFSLWLKSKCPETEVVKAEQNDIFEALT